MSINIFKRMFKDATLQAEDLFLLEDFQIGYLPGWAPERELAALLHEQRSLHYFMEQRCPQVKGYLEDLVRRHPPAAGAQELAACAERVVWTVADLLVYQKYPEVYDRQPFHAWDFSEVTSITPLEGKTVVDVGSGTGRVALEVALTAGEVFAVEPVSRLRRYIRQKAETNSLENVHVVDGFLHAIPLPCGFAEVLITSHALGWQLEKELPELERVVKRGGWVIHCPGAADGAEEDIHQTLVSARWGYAWARYEEADGLKRKYWKQVP